MKRKLILLAGKTMVISLPAAFVKKYNLKKSEEVELTEYGCEVRIRTDNQIGAITSIEVDSFESVGSYLDALYACGVDRIRIRLDDPSAAKKIQTILELYNLDYELVIPHNGSCVLEVIRKLDADQFENILRRVFHILTSSYDQNVLLPKASKLLNVCTRILHKNGYRDHNSTILMANLIFILRQLLAIEEAVKAFSFFSDAYYQFNKESLLRLKGFSDSLDNDAYKNLIRSFLDTIVSLHMLGVVTESEIQPRTEKHLI